MRGKAGFIIVCSLMVLFGCSKPDKAVGVYKGVKHLTAREEQEIEKIDPALAKKLNAKLGKNEGTLTIKSDGTASFSTNISDRVETGMWRWQNGYIVDTEEKSETHMKLSPDGRTITFGQWTLTRQ